MEHQRLTNVLVVIGVSVATLAVIAAFVYLFNLWPSKLPEDSVSRDDSGAYPVNENRPEKLDLKINVASISQDGGGTVRAIANIEGTDKNGTCVFVYSGTDNIPVSSQVTSSKSQCISEVAQEKFNRRGEWSLNVAFHINDQKFDAPTRLFTIR